MKITFAELKVLMDTTHDSLCIANRGGLWPFRWEQSQRIATLNEIMQRMARAGVEVADIDAEESP